LAQEGGVLRKELDGDRLGLVGKVADHVLQFLKQLHLHGGQRLGDPSPHVGHDLLGVACALALQLHCKVAAVGFGYGRET